MPHRVTEPTPEDVELPSSGHLRKKRLRVRELGPSFKMGPSSGRLVKRCSINVYLGRIRSQEVKKKLLRCFNAKVARSRRLL